MFQTSTAGFEDLEGGESEGGDGLGHVGESQRRLEVSQFWLGQAFHETVAGVGEQVRLGSDAQGGGR